MFARHVPLATTPALPATNVGSNALDHFDLPWSETHEVDSLLDTLQKPPTQNYTDLAPDIDENTMQIAKLNEEP